MSNRTFNPVPQDAPDTRTTMAHYIGVHTGRGADGVNEDRNKKQSRHYKFHIGRSDKVYWYKDKYMDDRAMELLEQCKENKDRLVLVGYISPEKNSPKYYATLIKFGVYSNPTNDPLFNTYNPDTGEKGYYELTGLKDMEETTLFMGTETY